MAPEKDPMHCMSARMENWTAELEVIEGTGEIIEVRV
jgi:hypothetical protein